MAEQIVLDNAYKQMYLIRKTEETIVDKYSEQEMRCPTHLSIGQEAVAVGVCAALQENDRIFSNHRCHAHYLAKGGDLTSLIAELYGKANGCAGGYGGSMHLVDEAVGMMGTSAVVGSSVPVAIGVATSLKVNESDNVVVSFIGDATRETGQFYECLNLAALWQLPIIFVCEDNRYATQTPLWQRQPNREFVNVAQAMGIDAYRTKNDKFETVYEATLEGLDNLPYYLEIPTYRFRSHVGTSFDYDMGYRTEEEVRDAETNDPLLELRSKVSETSIRTIHRDIDQEIVDAFVVAQNSPWPGERNGL